MYVTVQVCERVNRSKRGEKVWFLNPLKSEQIGKNAAAYATERLVLQETFF